MSERPAEIPPFVRPEAVKQARQLGEQMRAELSALLLEKLAAYEQRTGLQIGVFDVVLLREHGLEDDERLASVSIRFTAEVPPVEFAL